MYYNYNNSEERIRFKTTGVAFKGGGGESTTC